MPLKVAYPCAPRCDPVEPPILRQMAKAAADDGNDRWQLGYVGIHSLRGW